MKNRQISLYSYIVFLIATYGVWHLTIQSKKHGGYNLSQIPELIERLNNTITQRLTFYVEDSFTSAEITKLNTTLTNQYSKFTLSLKVFTKINEISPQIAQSEFQFTIKKGNNLNITIFNLQQVNIIAPTLDDQSILKNLRRYINKFYPSISDETQMESRQFYMNRLLIFDFYFVDKQNQSSYPNLIADTEQCILKLAKHFELPKENIKINYKFHKDELEITQDNKIEVSKQQILQFTENHKQVHSMNWKEYFQLDIFAIVTDKEVNVQVDSEEDVSLMYLEPTNFMFHINSNESLFKNVFQAFTILLQLEEQLDIIFERIDFHPSLEILKQFFLQREYLRQLKHFIDELEYISFLHREGDYKITKESQKEFERRVEFIIETAQQSRVSNTDTVDLLIDDRLSDLDTFSFEYTLGMYLPLVLPFAYPIILSIYDELSSK